MDQFKLLAVTLLYSSLRVLYNQNKHKDIKIKTHFLEVTYVLTAQDNIRLHSATSAPSDCSPSYNHHKAKSTHIIITQFCSRLKNCMQTA